MLVTSGCWLTPATFKIAPDEFKELITFIYIWTPLGDSFFFYAGSHLSSHTVSSAVLSAAYGLTIVFGMGTGVTHKRITTSKFYDVSYINILTT